VRQAQGSKLNFELTVHTEKTYLDADGRGTDIARGVRVAERLLQALILTRSVL